MRINIPLLKHILFWIFFLTAFWGAFEMAYQSGNHPIWSGTWGAPFPHHYVVGFIGIIIMYMSFTANDWVVKEKFLFYLTKDEKKGSNSDSLT